MEDITHYYNLICKEPLLSAEEEKNLFQEFYSSSTSESRKKEIRDKVVRANLRFVFKTARNFAKAEAHLIPDLISAGNEGLLVGFDKYNPNSGVRYLSYAGWWVNQRILSTMSKVRIVALPVWKQQVATRIQKAKENNEDFTEAELRSLFPEVSDSDFSELFSTRYLTYHIGDLDTTSPEFECNPIESEVEADMDATTLRKAVAKLESPYREVISCTYGLSGDRDYKPYQLAKQLGVPKDTLETICKRGLELLREALEVNSE